MLNKSNIYMKYFKIIFLILFLFLSQFSEATHILGGGFSLKWISDSTYELKLQVFNDCKHGTAQPDTAIFPGIFSKNTHERKYLKSIKLFSRNNIKFDSSLIHGIPFDECQEVTTYKDTIILSTEFYNESNGYYIAWERCCRNIEPINIDSISDTGITYYLEIPSPHYLKNSSPVFNNYPNKVARKNHPYSTNFLFIDADGDSLVYSLVNPIKGTLSRAFSQNINTNAGPYPSVVWVTGYDSAHQILGKPSLNINEKTGELTMNPDSNGLFISAIKVEEFRNNKKIGETRLEYEIYVLDSLNSTSTKENQPFNSSIKVYPNPFQNNLALEILAKNGSQIKLRVIDLFGKTLLFSNHTLKTGSNTIPILDVEKLNKGIYILMVENESELHYIKVIKD